MSDQLKEQAQADNGVRPWVSQPGPEESFNIAAGEHFAKQGSLPARKKLSSEDGVLTTIKGND